jgi:hypothetical protein
MSKRFDVQAVQDIKVQLDALEPAQRFLNAREVVRELEPEIRQAMTRGYTLDEVAERIEQQIGMSPNTLKFYLYSEEKRTAAPAKKTRRARSS